MGVPIDQNAIKELMQSQMWGTLIAIDQGRPYAVETSFAADDTHLYTGSRRDGRMNRCIAASPAAAFKICNGDHRGHRYQSAIVEGDAEILTSREEIRYCLRLVFTKLGMSIDTIDAQADRFAAKQGSMTLYRIPLTTCSGIRSARG